MALYKILLGVWVAAAFAVMAVAIGRADGDHWQPTDTYEAAPYNGMLDPLEGDVFGPGIGKDVTGRPFEWRTDQGDRMPAGTRVKPNVFGPGIGMDQYGRPVRAYDR